MNCVFIFLMQMGLTITIAYNFWKANDITDPMLVKELQGFQILITRFICAIILHLQIEGEVLQAIKMMKFTIYRTGSWNRRLPQFLVATMQLFGALSTEIVNLFLMCSFTESTEVIMNLLAFAIIAEIDDLYAKSLKNSLGSYLIDSCRLSFSSLGQENDNAHALEVNKARISQALHWFYRLF